MKKLIVGVCVLIVAIVFKVYFLEIDDTTYTENPRPPGVITLSPTFGGNNYLGPQVTTLPPTFKDKDSNPEYPIPIVRKE